EIAVDVELQQHRRLIRRPASGLRLDAAKPKLGQIELVDKHVDCTNRIVLADPILQIFRKQRALPAIYAFNEALHPIPRKIARESYPENHFNQHVFTQPGSWLCRNASARRTDCCSCPGRSPLTRRPAGRTVQFFAYILIAARSGLTPMMFMTRVRL